MTLVKRGISEAITEKEYVPLALATGLRETLTFMFPSGVLFVVSDDDCTLEAPVFSTSVFDLLLTAENNESVDDALIRVSKVLATNDANLRKKAKKKGIALVILRQKKYLAVEGYLV